MLPVFELGGPHVERCIFHHSEEYVATTDSEVPDFKAHRSASVAAAAALMKEQRPVFAGEVTHKCEGDLGGDDAANDAAQKKPIGFGS